MKPIILFLLYSLSKAVRVLIVAVYTTVYAYVLPYRSRLANYLEMVINLNFLLLLLISSTSFFSDDFFFFPSLTDIVTQSTDGEGYCGSVAGIAVVSWVLMPFYYLPVLVCLATAAVLATLYVRYGHTYKQENRILCRGFEGKMHCVVVFLNLIAKVSKVSSFVVLH